MMIINYTTKLSVAQREGCLVKLARVLELKWRGNQDDMIVSVLGKIPSEQIKGYNYNLVQSRL